MASTSVVESSTFPSSTHGGAYSLAQTGHSGRLRYADPRDLPSYPSIGLKKNDAAASAAASLGWANQKPFEHWKPDPSASASAAAVLAKDFKMAPAWEPGRSAAGHRAAALAAGSAQRQHQQKSEPPSEWGNSAANIAFRASTNASRISSSTPDKPSIARQGSLHAAKGAMALRQRSRSSPQINRTSYPDQANAASNALSAATIAHQPSMRAKHGSSEDSGAVPYTTMPRQMYTSHPPVKPEVDDQKRADVLHASAVAMAKRMYNQQQKMIDTTKQAHQRSSSFTRHGAGSPTRADDEVPQPMQFNNLQEAAYRLAQERLAKLHEEHQKNREFQEYYGSSATSNRRSRLGTIRGKLTRRRSASDSEVFDDERATQRIMQQMSLFNSKISQVDEQKRARDREALLAAAQRNVKAQLQGMDEKMYAETGRINPAITSSWEHKAQSAAQMRLVEATRNPNAGKIDIGGGKFMDQAAVDKIAAQRVQPLLDEINEKAEIERERLTAQKLDEERRKEETEKRKQREKEIQEIHKKLKEEQKEKDKIRKAELRHEEKVRKEEIKNFKAEQKHKGKEADGFVEDPESYAIVTEPPSKKASGIAFPKLRTKLKSKDKSTSPISPEEESPEADKAHSPSSKVKTWVNRLTRPRAKSSGAAMEQPGKQKQEFVGGAALTRIKEGNRSTGSIDNRSASMREVAMARASHPEVDEMGESSGTRKPTEVNGHHEDSDSEDAPSIVESVSSLSTDGDKFVEARSEISAALSPPPPVRASPMGRDSPVKESRFTEILD